ncbi:uncharacterized protein [Drosophila virilis]|uniref:Uncharacterized protein n=1 Tax=Drosophila virilis TaxID=7244 RepID=B4LEA6_DROVI|nr:uncharacterized protein LOC6623084 [Drosophila virilis]EDW69062.2 uncharacterized protein Dvir_GJ12328 [Drosophila virilis]
MIFLSSHWKMFGILQHLRLLLCLHYDALAVVCVGCIFLVGLLDYSHWVHGCDLFCWQQQLARVDDKPMALMLLIVGFKMLLILILTLLSYRRARPELEPTIGHVKQRYRRFIVMRLLAAHNQFLHGDEQIHQRHAELLQAIQLFRADARKLYERTSEQLSQSIQQMLPVEEQQEQELLQMGYDKYKCVTQLREVDIYRLVLALPMSKP